MPLIRLDDPTPDDLYTRTMIPVKRHRSTAAWAQFRDGGYEFHVDDSLHDHITDGVTAPEFQMEAGRPVAIHFVERK